MKPATLELQLAKRWQLAKCSHSTLMSQLLLQPRLRNAAWEVGIVKKCTGHATGSHRRVALLSQGPGPVSHPVV